MSIALKQPFINAFVAGFLTATSCLAQTAPADADGAIEGFSQPNRLARVASSISAIVEELSVTEGSKVQSGDCLVKLDSSVHEKMLAMSRTTKDAVGEIDAANSALEANQSRLTRIEQLAERGHASLEERMRAEEDVNLARANLRIAHEKHAQREMEYEKLLAELRQFCISAPFDGVVVEYLKEKGEYVGPVDAHVCTVAELSTLSVDFLVPKSKTDDVAKGRSVTVLFVDSNSKVNGTISYVSPYPDGETNMYTVKVRVPNADYTLTAGQRCQLQLSATPREPSKARDSR